MDSSLISPRQKTEADHQSVGLPATCPGSRAAVFCAFILRSDGASYFVSAGPGARDLFGVDLSDLQRDVAYLRDLIHPDDLDAVRKSLSASAQDLSQWHAEFRITHPAKGIRWIESHFTPTLEADGSVLWTGVHLDNTDRKRSEQDQDFLLDLGMELQNAPDPATIARVSTRMVGEHFGVETCTLSTINLPRNEVILVSQFPERVSVPEMEESQPLNIWADPLFINAVASGITIAISDTATHPATAEFYPAAFQPAHIRSVIVIPLRRAGEWLAALCLLDSKARDWSPREIHVARSAAERIWPAYDAARALASERSLHEALVQSEHRLRLALQSGAIGIWESDARTGERIWDARSRAIFGFPPDLKISAETILSCVHPEDRELVHASIQEYTNPSGSGRFQIEHRILTWGEGMLRYVYGQGQTMFATHSKGSRKAVRSVGTLQDVTALKRGEQTLRRMNQELEQFAYAAAHDLQEPLRCTGLAAQMLAERYRGKFDADADYLLKTASEGTLRMQAMVRGLLSFSRALESADGVLPPASSNEAVSLALQNLDVAIRETQAEITCEPLSSVRMREGHLLQVFQNLIGNAIKYAGGKKPVIHIFPTVCSGVRVFAVRDNGIGIPPEYHERVFGIFKRLHRDDIPGTGMGLALCKRIVEFYGGRIWLEPTEGGGTTVLFSPPLADERQA